jgi:hypothetical protein
LKALTLSTVEVLSGVEVAVGVGDILSGVVLQAINPKSIKIQKHNAKSLFIIVTPPCDVNIYEYYIIIFVKMQHLFVFGFDTIILRMYINKNPHRFVDGDNFLL